MKKLWSILLTLAMMTVSLTNVDARTWQTGNGAFGTAKTEDNVTTLTGTPGSEFEGQVVGPYSKDSKAKLSDEIKEEVYILIDNLESIPEQDLFEVTVSLDESAEKTDKQLTERVVMAQKIGDALVVTHGNNSPELTGWAPNFKVEIKENGVYTFQWNYFVENKKAYVNFKVLHGDSVLGETGKLEMPEIDVANTDVQVRSLWFTNIKMQDGVKVREELPSLEIKEEDKTDVTVSDKNFVDVIEDTLKNVLVDKDVNVTLTTRALEDVEETTVQDFEQSLEVTSKEAKIVNYFDISILVNDGEKSYPLTELNKGITLTVALPELPKVAKGYTRSYYILREHNGKVEKLDATTSKDGKSVSFVSNQFSTYALVYADTKITKNPETLDGISNFVVLGFVSVIMVVSAAMFLNKNKQHTN